MNNLTGLIIEKIKLNEKYYVLNPKKCITGRIEVRNEENVFIDEQEKEHVLIYDYKNIQENELGVAFIAKNCDLMDSYFCSTLEEAQEIFLNFYKTLLNIVVKFDDKKELSSFCYKLDALYNNYCEIMNDAEKNIEETESKEIAKKEENISDDDLKWLPEYIIELMNDLLKMNSIDEMKEKINELKIF